MEVQNIAIDQIPQFSLRDRDYYIQSEKFKDFTAYPFEFQAFKKVIQERSHFNIDRDSLYAVLKKQYDNLSSSELTLNNIEALRAENSFTITTAHQPSLLTGPLYYVFKILSAIKLAKEVEKQNPGNRVIPIFVIGGEDHDFEEINHAYVFGKEIKWENQGSGSVGDFSLDGLKECINTLNDILGDKSKVKTITEGLLNTLSDSENYGEFSFRLTHTLFDRFGVVILRMGDPELKRLFIPSIKKEILYAPSKALIENQQLALEASGYKAQTHVREINFFYKGDGFRKRIEWNGEDFVIVDTAFKFSRSEMEAEIDTHPEKFSPNVNMRPLFQSQVLPDLAYVGGGGELAYWLERKTQFAEFGMHFPMLVRRRSGMIINESTIKQGDKLGLSITQLFQDENSLVKLFLDQSDHVDYKLDQYKDRVKELFVEMGKHISQADNSLSKTTLAEGAKSLKSIEYLESKLKKSLKQKEEVNISRISKLKSKLFPSGLQERHDNIFEYLSMFGESLIDKILDHCDPMDKNFKVFIMQQEDR